MDVELIKTKIRELYEHLDSDKTACDTKCDACPFICHTDEGDFCGIGTLVNDLTDIKFIKETI